MIFISMLRLISNYCDFLLFFIDRLMIYYCCYRYSIKSVLLDYMIKVELQKRFLLNDLLCMYLLYSFTFTSLENVYLMCVHVIFHSFYSYIFCFLKDVILLKFQAKQQFWRLKQKVTRKSLVIYYAWTGKIENIPLNALLPSHSNSKLLTGQRSIYVVLVASQSHLIHFLTQITLRTRLQL